MQVPEGWERKEFSEVATLGKSKINPKDSTNSYPCIELEHIAQGTGKLLGTVNSTELASSKNIFHKGDILFGKLRPYLKKYFYCDFDGICSSEIWVLKAKDGCANNYLYNIIQTHNFISAANVSSGSKMPRADWKYVSEYPVLLPPLPEQQKIAQILSTWDKAIEKLEALIAAKQKRKKALMQQLLIGKKRFAGFEGKWKKVRLSDLGKCIRGVSYKPNQILNSETEESIRLLRSTNIQNGNLNNNGLVITAISASNFSMALSQVERI
jgi:type I restriction enzyme S subunit